MYRNAPFSLRQVQYIVAIDDTGGFGLAAAACGVSQPSLSAQVAKIESSLGVQLFERHARQVFATAACRSLLPYMRALLAESRNIEKAATAAIDPELALLAVGVIPTIAPYLLPTLCRSLRRGSSAPQWQWLELKTADCERELAAGTLDAIIIADPPTQPSVDHVELGAEKFVAVVPMEHRIARRTTIEELLMFDLLLLEDGHCLREHALSLCATPGTQQAPYRATSLVTVVQMVAAGMGITILPAMAVKTETSRADVRVAEIDGVGTGRNVYLAWRARNPHRSRLRRLATQIRASMDR